MVIKKYDLNEYAIHSFSFKSGHHILMNNRLFGGNIYRSQLNIGSVI